MRAKAVVAGVQDRDAAFGYHPRARLPPSRPATTLAPGYHPRARLPPSRPATTLAPGYHPRARLPPRAAATTVSGGSDGERAPRRLARPEPRAGRERRQRR
ncbi:hypothetical protein Acsp02_59010 [Actinoplanes sp. NBRC 103695]|nr:hypothetical protein Acsp02_59010 [Actinoplanes sp. NBRC 103695]